MEVVTCVLCGALFQTFDRKICPKCAEKEENYYQIAKKAIKENPYLKFKDIVEQTGVPERLLRRWLQDGRLEVRSKESLGIRCEKCGKEILQGKYCVDCRTAIQNDLNGVINEQKKLNIPKEKGAGMRYFD